MADRETFDATAAHKHFSVLCFNRAWDLIAKPARTPDEDEEMIRLSLASQWHWTQREDCTATNRSIGYWQVSRIFAVLGQADNARRYAELCLETSQSNGISPFFLGYAYEALARAEAVAGNKRQMKAWLGKAYQVAESMNGSQEKKLLLDDLRTIKPRAKSRTR